MPHYTYTETSNFIYDATMTQGLLQNVLDDELFYKSNSSGYDTHQYSLPYHAGTLSKFTGSKHKPNPEIYSGEGDGEEVHPSIVYDYYQNFVMATNVNFAEIRSSAVAAGISSSYFPNGLTLCDNTSAGNITFDKNGGISLDGSNTLANDITFIDGGEVLFTDAGSGTQRLTGLLASKDLEYIEMGFVARGGSSILSGGQVRRNLRHLNVGVSTNNPVSGQTGSGLLVDGLVVRGVLNSVYVASGASVNHLTVGLDRQWSGSDVSAFVTINSSGVPVPTYWGSQTTMIIASGGTATNITLGNGGRVYVSGLSDTVSSQWISSGSNGDGYWEYTTHYASGTGGILKDLNIASSGGLQFEGINDPRATWGYPSNGYLNSSSYRSGFLATAPQSAYVSFGSNASGSNINIGNGGSLYIGKGAHVSAISMGGLTTSTFFKNSSGTTDTWIGDRGAKLQINGGYVSGVVMDPVLQTFDYYSAAHDYFWLHSEAIKDAYSSAHGSYGSGEAWSSAMYASASATYRQYMSAMYTSGAIYTNLGDDTAYERRYVGGTVSVNGGWIMNVSGFSYLGVAADVDVKVENNVSSWNTYQYTDGNVSKAVGAVSATLDVTGGAHVYNVKIEGGRVLMVGGGEVNARWHSRENKQSNYNLVEDLDLRIDDVLGFGSAYPAVIEFHGGGSGGYSQAIHDSKGNITGYVDYTWDAIDPGEIHSVTASKGLVVSANWTTHQDFTYIGSGAVTFNGLGTVVLKNNHSRYTSDSWRGSGPYLGSAFDTYYFGVVKGVYNEEDGVLENYTVLDGTDGAFDWTGFLMVGSGGIVRNIGSAAPLKTGNNIVNSDTWTPVYDRDACKVLTVVAGGSADNVTVKGAVSNFEHFESQYTESRAGLLVSSGGTATNVTVLEGGIAMAKGGTIDKVFVGAGGTLYLSGWAGAHQVGETDSDYNVTLSGPQYLDTTVLNGVRLDSGGQLTNTLDWGFRKGHAPSVIANKGGGILNGVTANGVAYVSGLDYAGNITLTKDQQAIDVTVRGFDTITSRDAEGKPLAYTTTIASLNVSSGGIVKGATVGEEGAIYVSEGADVSGLTASGGRLIFENAGSGWGNYLPASATVNGITVKDGGILQVNSKFGLTASNVQIGQNAGLEFTLGDTASEDYTPTELNGTWTADWGNGTFYTDDGTMSGFGGQFGQEYKDLFYSSSYVSARLSMTVAKGGILTGADLRGYGSVRVTSGGKIFNTKIKGVGVSINSGGYASGLSALTDPDRTANQTQIWAYGSGATLDDTVLNGGLLGLEIGAVANGVTMTAPEGYTGGPGDAEHYGPAELDICPGGTANDVVASAGIITLEGGSKEPGTAGPTLNNADVHSAASIVVTTDDGIMSGKLNLGGTVNTTAKRYEYVPVEVDDVDAEGNPIHYTDYQRVEKNNAVVDATNLTVNFDLTERNGLEETAMIDNLANLQGATLASITISADQENGSYVLAGGSEAFKGSLTIKCDSENVGNITVGEILQVGSGTVYKLSNTTDAGLVFSVMSTDAAVTDILATVDGQPFEKGKWTNKSVTIRTEVNQYAKSIWYRLKKAVLLRGTPKNDDGWIELDNEKGLTVSEYCTVEFKAKNENGADSRIVSYTVNYDASAPEIGELSSDFDGVPDAGVEVRVFASVWDDLDESPLVEVSSGNQEWTEAVRENDGRYSFTVTGGTPSFTLRATDHAGNQSSSVITIPAAPSASADIVVPTNRDVTVSAVFSADSMQKQYSVNGSGWLAYTGGIVMEENGEVQFRAGNILGYSDVVSYTVSNIDKVPPEAPTAAADITTLTNKDVTVTAVFSADSAIREYSLNGSDWNIYTVSVIMTENGTVSFRGTDEAGNVSEVTAYRVTNIDKVPPEAPTAAADITTLTNKDVTVTAVFSDDSAIREYSLNGSDWNVYIEPVIMTENGTVSFRGTDEAGNISEVTSFTVSNIDKVPPEAPTASADVTAATNKDVTVTAVFSDDSAIREYSLNGSDWNNYTDPIIMAENGIVSFRGTDEAGNISEVTSFTVSNIDKVPPEAPTAAADITEETSRNVTVTAVFSDDSTEKQYSFNNTDWNIYTKPITMSANGTVYFRGIDAAGNISEITSYEVSNIVTHVDVPTGFTVSVKNYNAAFSWNKIDVPEGLTAEYEILVNGGEETFTTSANKYTAPMDVGDYTFAVRAVLSDGSSSEWSAPVEKEVKDVTPPVVGTLTVTQSGKDSVLAEWTAATDNVGIDHYVVTCGNENEEVDSDTLSYEFSGLGGKVTVTLTAFDAAGNASKTLKQSLKIADVTPPDQVTGLDAEDNGKAGVLLSWEKPYDNVGVTEYLVTVDEKNYKSKTNSLKVTKLAAGEHTFNVVALDKAKNQSDPSDDHLFEVADYTPPVTGALSLEQDGDDGVRLSWTAGSDDSGKVAYYKVTCGEQKETVFAPNLEHTFTGVGGKVTATLTAYDAADNAGKTVKKTITLKDVTSPTKVTGLSAEGVNNKTGGVLTWNPATDNVGVTQYLVSVEDENGKKTSYTSKTNSLKLKKLNAGNYKFTVVAVDKAKNLSLEREEFPFTVKDVIDPKIKKFSAKVNKDNTATVTWNATDETEFGSVKLTLDNEDLQMPLEASGTLILQDLSAGQHTLQMTAYDAAENSVTKTISFNVKGILAAK